MNSTTQLNVKADLTIGERISYFVTKWNPPFMYAMHTRIYQLTKGIVGAKMRGIPVLLLTTVGHKTGKRRTKPLMYLRDAENYVIIAANAGEAKPPAWWYNLQANPEAEIQVGAGYCKVKAEIVTDGERERLWHLLSNVNPFYEKFQEGTERQLDVVLLRPLPTI